jgi:hypothetical protein
MKPSVTFVALALLAPLMVLLIFWFVRATQELVIDSVGFLAAAFSTSVDVTVSATPGPTCQARLAGNFVVANCSGATRVVQLLGLRVSPPTTFETVLGRIFEDKASAPVSPPSLTCTIYESSGTVSEPLARCGIGSDDLGSAALRSGQVVLAEKGTVSRALLRATNLENDYVHAQDAARRERRGLWWDYPDDGDIDPIVWRTRQDAQAPSASILSANIQAWIAQVLVLAGGVVVFLFERRREAALERAKQMRLLNNLRRKIAEVEKASSIKNWPAAESAAASLRQKLADEGLSPDVLERWDDVAEHLQGHTEIDELRRYIKRFDEILKEDPALGLVP